MEVSNPSVIPISKDLESLQRSLTSVKEIIEVVNIDSSLSAKSRYSLLDYWLGHQSWLELCIGQLKK